MAPEDEWAMRLRANALFRLSKSMPWRKPLLQDAHVTIKEAVSLRPNALPAYLLLTSIEVARKNVAGADEASRQAVSIAPVSAAAWVARTEAALAAKDWSVAEAAAAKAIELDPNDYAAHNNLGAALRHLGRPRQAAAEFANAARLDPSGLTATSNLARLGSIPFRLLVFVVLSPLVLLAPAVFYLGGIAGGELLVRIPRVHQWSLRVGLRWSRSRVRPTYVFAGVVASAFALALVVKPEVAGIGAVVVTPFAVGLGIFHRFDRWRQARRRSAVLGPLRGSRSLLRGRFGSS